VGAWVDAAEKGRVKRSTLLLPAGGLVDATGNQSEVLAI
jgi:hypothetical protein